MFKGKINGFFADKGKAGAFIKSFLCHTVNLVIIIVLFMFFRLDMKDSFSFYANFFKFTRKVPVPLDILFLTDTRFYIFFAAAIAFSFPWWRKLHIPLNTLTVSLKYIALIVLFVLSFCTLATDAYNPFIYFRF
jgi:hypothetical protein